jgi:hypothetical protein
MSNSDVRIRVRKVRARKQRPIGRVLLRVIAATVIAWGAFLAFQLYHDSNTDYQLAMADCIQGRNKTAGPSSGEDASAAAMACATSVPDGK